MILNSLLFLLQNVLYRIFHDTFVNGSSRDRLLEYVANVLRLNEKRAQIQVVELANAGDGYMLNLLSVLQLLSVKVKSLFVIFVY